MKQKSFWTVKKTCRHKIFVLLSGHFHFDQLLKHCYFRIPLAAVLQLFKTFQLNITLWKSESSQVGSYFWKTTFEIIDCKITAMLSKAPGEADYMWRGNQKQGPAPPRISYVLHAGSVLNLIFPREWGFCKLGGNLPPISVKNQCLRLNRKSKREHISQTLASHKVMLTSKVSAFC